MEDDWLRIEALAKAIDGKTMPDGELADIKAYGASGRIQFRSRRVIFHSGSCSARRTNWSIPMSLWYPKRNAGLDGPRQPLIAAAENRVVFFDVFTDLIPADVMNEIGHFSRATIECEDVEFNRDDCSELVSTTGIKQQPAAVAQPHRGGRKPSAKWPDFVAAVAVWMMRRNDDAATLSAMGSDTLLAEVSDLAAEWGVEFERSTFLPGIQALLSRMKDEA